MADNVPKPRQTPSGTGLPGNPGRPQAAASPAANIGSAGSGNAPKPQAGSATESAKDRAQQMKDKAQKSAQEMGQAASEQVDQATEQAREKGREYATRQKQRIVSEIDACCSALDEAAERYDSESATNLGTYARSAADQLNRAKSYIEQRDMDGMRDDVEKTVRNHSELAYGACFIAGLGIARFLKASSGSRRREQADQKGTRPRRPNIPASPLAASVDRQGDSQSHLEPRHPTHTVATTGRGVSDF